MKTIITLAISAALLALNAPRIVAHENEEHGGHSKAKSVPATAVGIVQEIQKHDMELTSVIKEKKLSGVHEQVFAIRDLAYALPSKVAPQHQSGADAAARKIDKLAAELDKSGDTGDQAATEKRYKKFAAAIQKLGAHAR